MPVGSFYLAKEVGTMIGENESFYRIYNAASGAWIGSLDLKVFDKLVEMMAGCK